MYNKERNQLSPRCIKCIAIQDKERRFEKIKFIFNYLSDKCCEVCGETNPIMLDFHHKNPKNKVDSISSLMGDNTNIKKLTTELKKCSVLCRNCHAMYHAKKDNWLLYQLYKQKL